MDKAAIRVALTKGHPDLRPAVLEDFEASVENSPAEGGLELRLRSTWPAERVARVTFQGWYEG